MDGDRSKNAVRKVKNIGLDLWLQLQLYSQILISFLNINILQL